MNAAIDAGNSKIKVGLFEKDQLKEIVVFDSDPIHNFYAFLSSYHFEKCILSSVIQIPGHIMAYLHSKADHFVIMDKILQIPFENAYATPETLGNDRIALVAGGIGKYPDQNLLIISAGTCITYNFISADKTFSGGAISPGLHMRIKAMHQDTARLPLFEIEETPQLIEKNTVGSMASGVFNGIKFEIEGFASEIQKQWKDCRIILSGGDSRYLAGKLSIQTELEPDLALEGLNLILKLNASEKN